MSSVDIQGNWNAGELALCAGGIPCPTWLSWLIDRDNPFCPVHKVSNIIKNARIKEGMVVLDAGCGPGRVTIPVAKAVGQEGRVVALDIQEGMLSQVQDKAVAENVTNIEFLLAGLGDNALEKGSFDRVLMITVLGEVPNQKAALQEIYEALKPDGILSITEIIFDIVDFQSRSKVIELVESIGFLEQERFGNCAAYTINFIK